MFRTVFSTLPRAFRPLALVFTLAALVLLIQGGAEKAQGATYDPTLTAKYCNALPATFASSDPVLAGSPACTDMPIGATSAEDLTINVVTDTGESMTESPFIFNIPGTVTPDGAISNGVRVAGVEYSSTYSLLNGTCTTTALIDFVLYDSSTTGSLTVDPPSTADRFASIVDNNDGNATTADADSPFVTNNPDIYPPLFDPANSAGITPKARYTGATNVAGTWVLLSVFQFDAQDLASFATDADDLPHIFGRVSHLPTTGTLSVVVLDNPYLEVSTDNPIDEVCAPELFSMMLLGTTEGAFTRALTPAAGTAGISMFGYGQRDNDDDGIGNQLDTCPLTDNSGTDTDFDGIDDICDPTVAVDTGLGDHDGDGFANRQDTCPLVSNASAQVDGELAETYVDAAPDGGPKGDGIGDACDPNPLTSDTEGTAEEDYDLVVRCIAGTDTDGDGFCGPQDLDNGDAFVGGWPLNVGMDSEFRIAGANPQGDGFGGGHELYWGTDPVLACATTATMNDESVDPHPADTDDDGDLDTADVLLPVRSFFGTSVPPAPQRFDLGTGSTKVINLVDILTFTTAIRDQEDCLGRTPPPSSGASIPSVEIDMDVTGNGPRLGGGADVQTCGITTVSGTIELDIIAPAPGFMGAGLAGLELALSYDPAVVQVNSVDTTQLLEADAGSVITGYDDAFGGPDTDGTYVAGAFELDGDFDETGPGVLARITLEGVGAGQSALTLSYTDLYTMDGPAPEVYDVTTTGGATVVVGGVCDPDFENLSLTASTATSPAGAGRVRLNDIPLDAITGLGGTLPSAPLGSIPLGSIPLGSIPLGSIPLNDIYVGSTPLSNVPLSTIPLTQGSWESALAFTPLNNMAPNALTLAMVQAEAPSVLVGITLAQVNLGASSLRGISVGPLALGSLKLELLPVPTPYTDWCGAGSYMLLEHSFDCGGTDSALTMLDLNVRGAPLGSIPLGSIPLGSIPLGSIPLGSIPLGSIPLGSIPLGSIPLGSIPLGSINVAGVPLGSIPLGSINVPGNGSDWCTWLASQGAQYSCTALGIDVSDSLQDLTIALLNTGNPIASTPLGSIPLGSIPLGSIPLGSIPLGSIPLSTLPLGSAPLGSIPLGSIPLGSIDLDNEEVRAVPLSDPLINGQSLCTFLLGYPGYTCAPADLDLNEGTDDIGDLVDAIDPLSPSLQASPLGSIPLGSIPLGSIDWDSVPLGSIPLGSIPLGSIPLSAITLAETPLGSIPLGSIDPPGNYANFCVEFLASLANGEYTCSALGVQPTSTLDDYLAEVDANMSLNRNVVLAAMPLGSIPLGSIPLGSIPLGSIPLGSISIDGTPLGSIPLGSIDLGTSPLGSIPLTSIPLGSIPLGSIPLSSLPVGSAPLGSIPLGSIPLGSIPLGSIQQPENVLGDRLLSDINPPGPAISTVCTYFATFSGYTCGVGGLTGISDGSNLQALMEALDVMPGGIEASPLGSIPLGSIPLGSIDWDSVPLGSIPLGSIPLGSIMLSTLDLTGSPLGSIPLSSIEWQGMDICAYLITVSSSCGSADILSELFTELAPVESSPLSSIPLSSIPLGSIPLSSIDPHASRLGNILLSDIPNVGDVVNCTAMDCTPPTTDTLGDAGDAGEILPEARLRDIEDAVPNYLLGDLVFLGNTDLGDLFQGLGMTGYEDNVEFLMSFMYGQHNIGDPGFNFGNMTFGDILRGLLSRSDYAWEELPFEDIQAQRFAGGKDTITYTAAWESVGGNALGTELAVDLPAGFAIVPGSSGLYMVCPPATFEPIPDPVETGSILTGPTLTWTVDILAGCAVEVSFAARAGLVLGSFTADATASIGAEVVSVQNTALVTVTEQFEPENNDPDTGPVIASDEVIISHISSASDLDFYRVAVPEAGSRIVASLSHLTRDADLVMYRPTGEPVSTGIPLNGQPIEDEGPSVGSQQESYSPDTHEDVHIESTGIASLSASRGLESEKVESISAGAAGFYPIQVSGYNGRFSSHGYVLRVRIIPPQEDLQCGARILPNSPGTPGGSLPGSLPVDTKTLFLFNRTRLTALYGAAEAQDLLTELSDPAFINRADVEGTIIHVDANTAVSDAYDDWDDINQCSTDYANAIADEIVNVIDGLTTTVDPENIVVVGSDDVIPFGRVPDNSRVSNESDFAGDFELIAGDNNPTWASFAARYVLTDNVYGDRNPIPWLEHELFVPDRAVGRLIETPDEIVNTIQDYVTANGRLDPATAESHPRTSLTTGYDFLADGADDIDATLGAIVPQADELIHHPGDLDPPWTADDLEEALNPGAGYPADIVSLNAHFDHYRVLPADEDARGQDDDTFSTADMATFPAERLKGRILFSMGCHSGLNVPDTLTGSPLTDWVQELSRQSAVFIGNTGYGYGDTELVALSERLMSLVADRLDSTMTIGQALTFAKQEYFAGLGVYGVYDEKVISEATFYGLPMYRVGPTDVPPPAPPAPLPTEIDPATGLESASIASTPIFSSESGTSGDYYTVDGKTQVTHNRPIQPRVEIDVTQPDTTAHGAIITDLTSTEIDDFDVAFARPVIDKSENEPITEPGEVIFPTALQNISTYTALDGERQRLVLLPGQYIDIEEGDGDQRLFTEMDATVLYSNDDDYTEPELHSSDSLIAGSTASFSVVTDDDSPTTVIRVLVLYRSTATPSDWQSVDLVREGLTDRWTGGGAFAGTDIEYIVQAVDHAGNVATSTNKGTLFEGDAPPSLPPYITVEDDDQQLEAGWHEGPVTVTVTGTPGVIYTRSVDGSAFTTITGPFNVTGDGVHTVVVSANNDPGNPVTIPIPIDDDPPQIVTVLDPPANAAGWNNTDVAVQVLCSDSGSGVENCTIDPPPLITTEGTTALDAHAADFLDDPLDGPAHETDIVAEVKIDKTDPVSTAVPADPDGDSRVSTVTINATDAGTSDVKQIRVAINGGPPTVFAGASALVTLPSPSASVDFFAVDNADNTEATQNVLYAFDNCPTVANPGQENADGDSLGDVCDNCPTTATSWVVPPADVDCDGFTGANETSIGTNPADPCGFTPGAPTQSENWPPDLVETNSINIQDVLALKPFFGSLVPPTSARYDVTPSGAINIQDVLALKPFFGASCVP